MVGLLAASDIPVTTSFAGSVTAIAAVLTAIALVLGALPALLQLRRDVKQVHIIVNQQHTDSMNFQRALIRALQDAGVDVPVDQSLNDPREKT